MLSEDERDALRATYGEKTAIVDNEVGVFVFAKPSPIHWERYQEALTSDNKKIKKSAVFVQLCRDCLVHPKTPEGKPDYPILASLFAEYPALPITICGSLSDLAGAGESHVGKL